MRKWGTFLIHGFLVLSHFPVWRRQYKFSWLFNCLIFNFLFLSSSCSITGLIQQAAKCALLALRKMLNQHLTFFWIRCRQKDSFTNRSWKEKAKTRKWWREASWWSPIHLPAKGCPPQVCEGNQRHCLDWSRVSGVFCHLWMFSLPLHCNYKLDERW